MAASVPPAKGVSLRAAMARRIPQTSVLYPAYEPNNQSDDKNSSKDAAEIHRNLLPASEHPIETDQLQAVGALPHIDHWSQGGHSCGPLPGNEEDHRVCRGQIKVIHMSVTEQKYAGE